MASLWEVGKKAGVAGVILMSLPVLVPCAFVLTFAGALLAVPVGSAAVGFYACKKLAIFRRMRVSSVEYYPGNEEESLQLEAGAEEQHGPSDISAEEAPEKGAPGRVSDDFIVVEKPCSEDTRSTNPEEQCKTAPDYFQCLEAKEYEKPEAQAGEEAPQEDQAGKIDEKNEAVGLSVILEDSNSKKSQEQHLNKKSESKEPVHANGSVAPEEPPKEDSRSSVDEYVSLPEEFPSSDESVASSRNSSFKPGATEKEMRARLRKELALVKKVVGCKDSSGGSLSDQVERLYGFLGVELPSNCRQTNDYEKLLEAMNVLKAVVGVK